MKIITILSLYITASLSLAHSTLSYKERSDAFVYAYSQVCADAKNCTFPATFDALYKKSYTFFDIYDFPECTYSKFITDVHGIPPCPIQYKDLNIRKYGFPSESEANINIQFFDSPAVLKTKPNHPS